MCFPYCLLKGYGIDRFGRGSSILRKRKNVDAATDGIFWASNLVKDKMSGLIPRSWVLLEKVTGSRLVKLPTLYGTPKVNYRVYKCPPSAPILSQIDRVHAPTSHFLKIHLNIIPLSKSGSIKWSISLKFRYQNPVYISPEEGDFHSILHVRKNIFCE
jgi:hypothetical protein